MYHLYTDITMYGVERQKRLQGERRPEKFSLKDGRALHSSQWLHKAAEWLEDQLAFAGKNLPCIDNDLACDMQFVG